MSQGTKQYMIKVKADFGRAAGVNLSAYLQGMQWEVESAIRRSHDGGEVGMLILPRRSGDPAQISARMSARTAEDVRKLTGVISVDEWKP